MTREQFELVFVNKSGDSSTPYPPEHWRNFQRLDARRDIASRAGDLASSAIDTFLGVHNLKWPFLGGDLAQDLPWADDYWNDDLDHETRNSLFQSEVLVIAEKLNLGLSGAYEGDTLQNCFGAAWYSKDLMSSKKSTVQGLSVQILACVNACWKELFRGNLAESASCLGAAYDNIILMHIECQPLTDGRSKGGVARHRNDPKAKDKAFVKACWEKWKLHPERYTGVEAFARDMLTKTEHLEGSTQVIGRWVRNWRKASASSVNTKS